MVDLQSIILERIRVFCKKIPVAVVFFQRSAGQDRFICILLQILRKPLLYAHQMIYVQKTVHWSESFHEPFASIPETDRLHLL